LLTDVGGHGRTTMWGDELNEMWPHIRDVVKVTHQFRPFELVPNESPDAIAAFFGDETLDLKRIKGEVLRTLGLLGKTKAKSSQTRVFALESEALHFRNTYGGDVKPYHYNVCGDSNSIDATADVAYVWTSGLLTAELESGFAPVYNRQLSGCRLRLARTALHMLSKGITPRAANTDALFGDAADLDLMAPFNKRDPANFGRLSCKLKALPEKGEISPGTAWDRSAVKLRPRVRPVNIEFEHESSSDLMHVLPHHDGFIKADAPGSGKTYILMATARRINIVPNVLFVTPNNTGVIKFRNEGFASCTLATLLGLRVQRGQLVENETGASPILRPDGTTAQMKDFDYLFIDEAGMVSASERGRLTKLIAKLRDLDTPPRIWATADVDQIPPIEMNVNPCVDQKKYIADWLANVFPRSVTLHKLRRWSRVKCQERIQQVKRMLFTEKRPLADVLALFPHITRDAIPADAHIISYLRDTRRKLNAFMHARKHTESWVVGELVVYDSHTRMHGKRKMYKNFEFKITAVNEHHIDIVDVADAENTFRLSLKQADEWLAYPYANTCHSAQGATYDVPIVIANSKYFRVSREWLYVALTRNRDTRTVYILDGEVEPKPIDKKTIERNIQSHNAADAKAGREVGDLNVAWVLDRFEHQHGLCALCAGQMEMPRYGEHRGGSSVSIDRIVSVGRGHVRGNVQLTCRSCNFAKGSR